MTGRRLVLLAAEPGSLDQLLGASLPPGVDLVVATWDAPGRAAEELLGGARLIAVGDDAAPVAERALSTLGGDALQRVLRRSPAGRLLDSVSPLHRSRRFAARVERRGEWTPGSNDDIVALDAAAGLLAWRTVRRVPGATATLGLAAALERLTGH